MQNAWQRCGCWFETKDKLEPSHVQVCVCTSMILKSNNACKNIHVPCYLSLVIGWNTWNKPCCYIIINGWHSSLKLVSYYSKTISKVDKNAFMLHLWINMDVTKVLWIKTNKRLSSNFERSISMTTIWCGWKLRKKLVLRIGTVFLSFQFIFTPPDATSTTVVPLHCWATQCGSNNTVILLLWWCKCSCSSEVLLLLSTQQ